MGLSYKAIFYFGILLLLLYFEFMAYWILPLTWIQQPSCKPPFCKKLLLVADPQIVGPEWNSAFLDWIAIFDSDRYIKRTFLSALNFIQPDIIIYLGDLMDQGWLASEPDYISYLNRLTNIFEVSNNFNKSKFIFAPGDNDIGGIDEILMPSSVKRFDKTFNQTENSIINEFIEFCNANLMTYKLQESKLIDKDVIRVVLSHVPLIPKRSYFLNEVIKKIKPHLILSGHMHKAYHYRMHENDLWKVSQNVILPQDAHINVYKLEKGIVHQITVPTCSYRMGVSNMGYGVLYIDIKDMKFQYSVLWTPQRFFQLFIYLFIVSQILLIELLKMCRKMRWCAPKSVRNSKLYLLL